MARLLCFIGEITVDFQSELTKALSDQAAKNGHEIVFCVNFDTNSVNAMHGEIEKQIMYLPNLQSFDGIIICPDTYEIDSMAEELSRHLEKYVTCPVISVRDRNSRFYNILLDDGPAIANMVEHFISVHHFTRICFMTGHMDLEDAHRRLQAYRDVMAQHHLEVTDGMVFYGDYWRTKGEEAVSWFFENNSLPPEAIVCANDYMAISVCNALFARNLRVPDDVCVSGFDDIDEACYHLPPITSIHASVDAISREVIRLFSDVWNGKPRKLDYHLPLEAKYRKSCGCEHDINFAPFQRLYRAKETFLSALHFCPYISLDFEAADTVSELFYSIFLMLSNKSWGSPEDFGTMYFCFCDENERQNNLVEMASHFTEHMVLSAIISKSGVTRITETFPREQMLPPRFMNPKMPSYLFALHCKEYCYGYIVMQNDNFDACKHLVKTMIFSIGNALDRIRIFSENQLVQQLRAQTYVDELTQIPNRRQMEHFIRKLFERLQRSGQSFCIMSIDMDGLKYINDTFGHLEGDSAIITIAQILQNIHPSNGIAARIGGDEYSLLFPSENEKDAKACISALQRQIDDYNLASGKPYQLSVSVGYEYCRRNMELLSCLHSADKKMYEQKKSKTDRHVRQ